MPAKPLNKIPPLVKWLALLMSLTFVALGLLSMVTEHYYGRSSRTGSEYMADGAEAVLIGIGQIVFGLAPMALWAKSAKAAGYWAAGCLIFGVGLMLAWPLLKN